MKDSMTCEAFEGLLPRYLEGETGDAERTALEAHAGGCAECGQLLAELREITREAGMLPVLVPSRDLWDGIAARIEAPAIPLDSRRQSAATVGERPRSWRSTQLAAAAAVLMVATAGVTHVVTRQMMAGTNAQHAMVDVAPVADTFAAADTQGSAAVAPDAAERGAPMVAAAPGATRGGTVSPPRTGGSATPDAMQAPGDRATGTLVASPSKAEMVYDQEIALLQEMLDRRRAELDPATTVVLEGNLRIIDRAIRDSRAALARDPASGFLTDQLTMALDKKLQLMRTAARLPART